MGIPNDVPWYTIIGIGIVFGIHDTYQWLRLTVRRSYLQTYDHLEDSLNSISLTISKHTDDILYQIGASGESQIPRTFPRFKELPAEIRVTIWEYALPGPRTIEIRHLLDQGVRLMRGGRESARSICRIPSLLQVSREARGVALKAYELAFGLELDYDLIDDLDGDEADDMKKSMEEMCRPKIYVDFKRDTIYFGVRGDFYGVQSIGRSDGRVSHIQGLEKLRFLALRSKSFGDVGKFDLSVFKSLEELVLVTQEDTLRRFDLGREPMLGQNSMLPSMALTNVFTHFIALDDKFRARVDRKAPGIRIVSFHKREGDKWHCDKRGPRWMF